MTMSRVTDDEALLVTGVVGGSIDPKPKPFVTRPPRDMTAADYKIVRELLRENVNVKWEIAVKIGGQNKIIYSDTNKD